MKNLLRHTLNIKEDGFNSLKKVNFRSGKLARVFSSAEKLANPLPRYFVLAVAGFPILVSVLVVLTKWSFFLPKCQFQAHFGFPAPSCGLTRSVLFLFQGDLQESLKYHLFGPIICVVACVIATASTLELYLKRSFIGFYKQLVDYRVTLLFVSSFLIYYVFRLWIRYDYITLPFKLDKTSTWQFLVDGAKAL